MHRFWAQRDPREYSDGLGLYTYVRGNPLGLVDPMGLVASSRNAEMRDNCPTLACWRCLLSPPSAACAEAADALSGFLASLEGGIWRIQCGDLTWAGDGVGGLTDGNPPDDLPSGGGIDEGALCTPGGNITIDGANANAATFYHEALHAQHHDDEAHQGRSQGDELDDLGDAGDPNSLHFQIYRDSVRWSRTCTCPCNFSTGF